jgi:hypothetical protein
VCGSEAPALAALVDEHVHVGGAGLVVGAHARAPDLQRVGDLLGPQLAQRDDRVGAVDHHLVRAGGGAGAEPGRGGA